MNMMIIRKQIWLILSLSFAWFTVVKACEKCQPFCDSFNELFIKPITTSQELQTSQPRRYLSQTYRPIISALILPFNKPEDILAAMTQAIKIFHNTSLLHTLLN